MCWAAGTARQSGGGERAVGLEGVGGGSHCSCAPNLALSENRWKEGKGAATALGKGEEGQLLVLSYADTQYSEETTDKYCGVQNIVIYHIRLAGLKLNISHQEISY